ncbi:MAG: autotransporter-associated beta strand repeat-containing protein, partial [Burkholderiales bacterium]|nr:autotransporter-associated beta strand repeat-containing protein [Phycisphaerae bacterium]
MEMRVLTRRVLLAAVSAVPVVSSYSYAADVLKADNADNLELTTSWVGGVAPTTADVAVWDSTVLGANTVALGVPQSYLGLRIANPGGDVTISPGAALTLGLSGIDMSASTVNLNLQNDIVLGASQTWNINTARTLNASGIISDAALGFGITKSGAGNLILSGINTYTGTTELSAGVLTLNNANAIGSGALTITGGSLDSSTGAVLTTNNLQNWNADFGFVGTNNLDLGTGAVTMSAARTITVTANTLTVGGVVSGPGSLNALDVVKAGAGTLNLSNTGNIAFRTGGQSVTSNAGTMNIAGVITDGINKNALDVVKEGAGVVALTDAGIITLRTGGQTVTSNAGTLSIAGAIAGGVGDSLTKAGAGNVTLTGANTYTGGTFIPVGTLALGASNVLEDTGAVNVTGGTFAIGTNTDTVGAVTMTSGSITGAAGGSLSGTSYAVDSGTISASLGGAGLLTKSTSGTLTLSGANTHTGGVTLNAGTLNLNAAGVLGTGGTFTINGGTIDKSTAGALTLNTANPQTWNADFTYKGTANLNLGTGPVTLTGNRQVNLLASTLTVPGGIGGAFGLTLQGLGSFAIGTTVVNTFTGPLTMNGVNMTFTNSATVLNNNFSASMPLVLASGFLRQNNINNAGGHSQTFASTTISPGASQVQNVRTSGGIPQLFMGTVARSGVGGTVNFNPSSASGASGIKSTNTGMIGGWAFWGLNKPVNDPLDFANGNGPATNMNAVSHTGGTNIFGAGINTDVTGNFAVAGGTNTQSLRFGTAGAFTVTLNGASQITSGGILVNSTVSANNQVITGGTLSGATNGDLVVYQNSSTAAGGSGTLTINSVIADATSTALTKAGTGVLILGGNNTFTGGVYINSGETRLANAGALNSTTPNAVTFTNGNTTTVLSQILSLNGNSAAVSGLNTSAVVGTGTATPTVQNGGGSNAILTVNNSAANTFAGRTQDGTGGGTFGITKQGVGNLTLGGSNTYTGATTVNAGTLTFSTSVPASSAFNVAASATLDVAGAGGTGVNLTSGKTLATSAATGTTATVNGLVTVNGGTVTTGAAGSTLQVGAMTLSTGAFNFNITTPTPSSGTSSLVNVTGALAINGATSLSLLGGTFSSANNYNLTYNLFQFGTQTGSLANLSVAPGSQVNGLSYNFGISGNNVQLMITGTPLAISGWITDGGGSWATSGNWSPSLPNSALATANFGAAVGNTNLARTVSLDSSKTVGVLNFASPNGETYTLTQGTGGSLILDNGATAPISVSGTHVIDSSVPVQLNSNLSIGTTNIGDSLTIGGVVSNGTTTGILTKSGAGTLVLSGANTYGPAAGTVGTNLNAGTIRVGNSAALGAGDLSFGGSATLQSGAPALTVANNMAIAAGSVATIDTNGNPLTLSGVLSGATGTLAVASSTGNGTLILTNAAPNTYGGGTTINTGATLQVGDTTATGSLPTTGAITNVGSLVFKRSDVGTIAVGNVISGVGTLTQNGAVGNVVQLTGANSYSGGTTITSGAIQLGANNAIGSGNLSIASGANLDLNGFSSTGGSLNGAGSIDSSAAGTMTLTVGNNGASGTHTGTIANTNGTINFVKGGLGTQTLSAAAYSGTTTVNIGTLTIGGSSNIQSTGAISVRGLAAAANMIVADNAVINTTGVLTVGNGTILTPGSTLLVRDNASLTSGSFVFGGNTAFTQNSSLTIQNTASMTVNGTFDLNFTAGSSGQTNTVNLNSGTLALNRFIQSNNNTGSAQNGIIRFNGGLLKALADESTFGGPLFLPAPGNAARTTTNVDTGGAKIDTNGFNITIATPLVHGTGTTDGGLDKLGLGTLTLTGAGTFNGDTVVTLGTLLIGNPLAIQASALNYNNQGGTLSFGTQTAATVAGLKGAQDLALLGLDAVTPVTLTTAVGTANTHTYSGALSGTGGSLVKTGAGVQVLSGASTYDGPTVINAGKLSVASAGAIGTAGNVTFGGGALQHTATNTVDYSARIKNSTGAISIDTNGQNVGYAGVLDATNTGGLTKSGTGVLTVGGVNAYTGTTTVNAGTLNVTGTHNANSPYAVT